METTSISKTCTTLATLGGMHFIVSVHNNNKLMYYIYYRYIPDSV